MKIKYVSIELSKRYHELAKRRHEMIKRGEDPFGKVSVVPAAKNSPVQRLPRRRYEVPKKVLQLEVKRIAQELNCLPTREEVQKLSVYPIEYYNDYFVSWGEVCAAARTTGMSEVRPVIDDSSLKTSCFAIQKPFTETNETKI